jgi:hypothetical protein
METPLVDPVALATGGIAGGLVRGAAAKGTVTFFRAVSAKEAEQIARTGTLEVLEGQVQGKYLTNTVEAAAEWGRRLYGEAASMVEVKVPKAAATAMERLGRIDGVGEAWLARMSQLKDAALRFLP